MMIFHVARRELLARWMLIPVAILIGALAMIAIQSIGHVRGDADNIMNGTWVGTLVVSTIVGMSLMSDELTNSRLSFYFARPFTPHAIFGGKLAAGVLVALVMQIAVVFLVALALPALSWRGSALAQRDVLSVGGERILATVGCTLLGMAASIALGSKTRWFVVDAVGLAAVGVLGSWFALRLEPDPVWLPADSIRSAGETALFHAAAFAIGVVGLGLATARALVLGRTDRMRAHRTMSMTLWPIVVPALVLVIFIGKQTTPRIPDAPVVENAMLAVPEVDTRGVLSRVDATVPYLLLLDETGALRVGAAASWAKLDEKRMRFARPALLERAFDGNENVVQRFLRLRNEDGVAGDVAVASVTVLDVEIDHETIRAEATRAAREAAARSATRPKEGHEYASEFLEHQTIVLAQAAGSLGLAVDRGGAGEPRHQAWTQASIRRDDRIPRSRPMVLAAPTAKVKSLIDVIAITRASIAVSHANKLRPLRFVFGGHGVHTAYGRRAWVEVRVSRSHIVVQALASTPITVTEISGIAAALDEARAAGGIDARDPVDVLLEDDVEAQRFVDVLVMLDVAGVRAVSIGHMPGAAELALRRHNVPTTSVSEFGGRGQHLWLSAFQTSRVSPCYSAALLGNPSLTGIVTLKILVEGNGKVASAMASGVDATVAACVADVFRTFDFAGRHRPAATRGWHELGVMLCPDRSQPRCAY